jgi:hypothetical protein
MFNAGNFKVINDTHGTAVVTWSCEQSVNT